MGEQADIYLHQSYLTRLGVCMIRHALLAADGHVYVSSAVRDV